jgi:hypothetical protein
LLERVGEKDRKISDLLVKEDLVVQQKRDLD